MEREGGRGEGGVRGKRKEEKGGEGGEGVGTESWKREGGSKEDIPSKLFSP